MIFTPDDNGPFNYSQFIHMCLRAMSPEPIALDGYDDVMEPQGIAEQLLAIYIGYVDL